MKLHFDYHRWWGTWKCCSYFLLMIFRWWGIFHSYFWKFCKTPSSSVSETSWCKYQIVKVACICSKTDSPLTSRSVSKGAGDGCVDFRCVGLLRRGASRNLCIIQGPSCLMKWSDVFYSIMWALWYLVCMYGIWYACLVCIIWFEAISKKGICSVVISKVGGIFCAQS